ncbi:MAG: thrombospondin type 3 repeat-containing protein [Verrucomicrobiota bacterium]
MSFMLSAGRRLVLLGVASFATVAALAQSVFTPQGGEYSLTLQLVGDQTRPGVSLGSSGAGYVVWQDNVTDGDGLGISAQALNNYLSPIPSRSFRVNQQGAGDQENPVVQVFADGSAVFVWQGGAQGNQQIFARFVAADGTFSTGDIQVNTTTNAQHGNPSVALLKDGSLLVVWASDQLDRQVTGSDPLAGAFDPVYHVPVVHHLDRPYFDVFGQRMSATGQKFGVEFLVNQTTVLNQRSPAVAGMDDGDFLVLWAGDNQQGNPRVDIYGRRYGSSGFARGGEFILNSSTNVCANPAVIAAPNGTALAAWAELDLNNRTDGWNVVASQIATDGSILTSEAVINTRNPGKRFAPQLARAGSEFMAVWTSDWQDLSREGVYGRFLKADSSPDSDEFLVNTTTISRQIQPAVASNGSDKFLVVWSSFTGLDFGYEVLGQRYSADRTLAQPAPPSVSPLDSYSLLVSWPDLAGYTNVTYLVYPDGSTTASPTTNDYQIVRGLAPGSTHSFQLAYDLGNGSVSPVSSATTNTTWGPDLNYDGLPDDWQAKYWGPDPSKWPAPTADSDGDGVSNLNEFLAGTDPTDPNSVLKTSIAPVALGILVNWNSVPGQVYQVQSSSDLKTWTNLGSPRFAPGNTCYLLVPAPAASSTTTFYSYRVIRIR